MSETDPTSGRVRNSAVRTILEDRYLALSREGCTNVLAVAVQMDEINQRELIHLIHRYGLPIGPADRGDLENDPVWVAASQHRTGKLLALAQSGGRDWFAHRYGGIGIAPYLVKDPDTLESILSLGADPDGKSVDGYTALHLAAILDLEKAAILLLKAGASKSVVGPEGLTPVDLAEHKARVDGYSKVLPLLETTPSSP